MIPGSIVNKTVCQLKLSCDWWLIAIVIHVDLYVDVIRQSMWLTEVLVADVDVVHEFGVVFEEALREIGVDGGGVEQTGVDEVLTHPSRLRHIKTHELVLRTYKRKNTPMKEKLGLPYEGSFGNFLLVVTGPVPCQGPADNWF